MKVHVVDLKAETISPPVNVRAYTSQTLNDFKLIVAEVSACRCDLAASL